MTDEHACKCQEPSAEDFERLADDETLFWGMDSHEANAVFLALHEAAERRKMQHYDVIAVARFAEMMKAKLAKAREKGRGGWDDPEQCTVEYLSQLLHEHVAKGDPVDVANLAMMLCLRGSTVLPKPDAGREAAIEALKPFGAFADALRDETPDEVALGLYTGGTIVFGPGVPSVGDLRRARTAYDAHRRGGAVRVKPLVWDYSAGERDGQHVWSSGEPWLFWIVKNPDNPKYVWCESLGYEGLVPASPVRGSFETLGEAKAAAQADFERRILSAIEVKP